MAAPIPCHLTATLRLGEPEEYLALPSRTALLGGHVFLCVNSISDVMVT